jgi:hypothetical protein
MNLHFSPYKILKKVGSIRDGGSILGGVNFRIYVLYLNENNEYSFSFLIWTLVKTLNISLVARSGFEL